MRAVNLIPSDRRASRLGVSLSPATLALLGTLVAALAISFLYVSASNTVASRESELADLTAQVQRTEAAAERRKPAPASAPARPAADRAAAVRELAEARYPWPKILDQLADVMAADAALRSLRGDGGASPGAQRQLQIQGCARSQSTVALTMERLRDIDNVTRVDLASSSIAKQDGEGAKKPEKKGKGSGEGDACPFPTSYSMTVTLGANAPAGAADPVAAPATTTTPAVGQ